MFIITTVTKWVTQRDGKARISTPEVATGRTFVLNTNRMVDIVATDYGSKFYFYDNHLDRREGKTYVECNSTVAELYAAKALILASEFRVIPVYKNNDIRQSTISMYFMVKDIAYLDAYRIAPPQATWIIYLEKGFKRVEILADYDIQELYYWFYGNTPEILDQYVYYEDEHAQWRKGCRNGYFMLDKALTGTGFLGIEDTDWQMVKQRS